MWICLNKYGEGLKFDLPGTVYGLLTGFWARGTEHAFLSNGNRVYLLRNC